MNNCIIPSTHAVKLPIFLINTLLLYIPLLALTDGQRNKYTRFAWAGGTFFPVVLLCQFLVLVGMLDILRMPIFGIWNSYVEAIASLLPCAFLAHIYVKVELTTTNDTHIAYMQGTPKECE